MISGLITVRSASTRLPKKCLLSFGENLNVLEHIINRSKFFKINPIICTSIDKSDDIIEDIAIKKNVKVFRGSSKNKLKRWADCCAKFNIENFHTIDADDPFFDGDLMKESIEFLKEGYDVVCPTKSSSAGGASVGYSLTRKIVDKAVKMTVDETDTEMMWYYLDKVSGVKKIVLPENNNKPKMRLTLDYIEDYWLLSGIRSILGNNCSRKEINELFERNPDLHKINWFRNIEWKKNQESKKV